MAQLKVYKAVAVLLQSLGRVQRVSEKESHSSKKVEKYRLGIVFVTVSSVNS